MHPQTVVRAGLPAPVIKTLSNTFWTVGIMMTLTAGTSLLTMGTQLGLMTYLGCFAGSLALVFATHAFRNSVFGLILLAGFSVLQGATLGPLLSLYLETPGGSSIVGTAAGLTALAAFACASYAITSRRDFSRMRGFLLAGLLVLIVASLVGLFVHIPALHLTIAAIGALLFTAWLLYDISAVVNGQEANYISASLSIYLDLLNLFIHLLRLLNTNR